MAGIFKRRKNRNMHILIRFWGGSAIGGDSVLELTPSFIFNFNYY